MKKITKKKSLKKKHKTTNYVNLISIIMIPIISILMTTYMSEKSYQNEKRATPPIFYLVEDSNNRNIIKINNVGGLASYIKFIKTTILKYTFGDKVKCLYISYTDKNELWRIIPNINRKDTWLFYQNAETISNDQIKEVFEHITKTANVENDLELLK